MIHTDLHFQNLPIILIIVIKVHAYYASIILTKKCAYYARNYASIIYQLLLLQGSITDEWVTDSLHSTMHDELEVDMWLTQGEAKDYR